MAIKQHLITATLRDDFATLTGAVTYELLAWYQSIRLPDMHDWCWESPAEESSIQR